MPREFNNRRVVVVGMGRSGVASARFLAKQGARVTLTDRMKADSLADSIADLDGVAVDLKLGGHDPEDFEAADLVVISPGVPHTLPIFEPARKNGTPVIGEMELAAGEIREPIIAVTGTNGKTTTTELLGEMLKNSGKKVFVGGNIGTPLTAYAGEEQDEADVVVAETSSFQLDTIDTFKPATAVVLNITDDHLDRYPSFDAYAASKWRILSNQDATNTAILNALDKTVTAMAKRFPPRARRLILSDRVVENGVRILKDKLIIYKGGQPIETFSLAKSALFGPHNRENIAAACLAALEQGATPEGIQHTLDTFKGLAHRLEPVAEVRGVRFVDDSKATNVDAVKRALECFDDPVVLIMGGLDKKSDFNKLKSEVRRRVKALVAMGQAKEEIVAALAEEPAGGIQEAGSMEEAVEKAFGAAVSGDVVLLSPACASFDMFDSYAQRGDCFQHIVERLR